MNDDIAEAIETLIATGKALGTPVAAPGCAPVVVAPEGYTLIPLPPAVTPRTLLAELPDHVRQFVQLHDAGSFCDYVKKYQDARTVIFAQPGDEKGEGAQFLAVFDYHRGRQDARTEESAEAAPTADVPKPERCGHTAVYPCPLSVEWRRWTGINGTGLNQVDFINFIENNALDVVHPESASLMEFAMQFEAKTNVEFATRVDRVTGGFSVNYTENIEGGAPKAGVLKDIPPFLKLSVPVFEGGQLFDITARLEWKPSNGKLRVTVHLLRPHKVIRLALLGIRNDIQAGTGLAPLTGAPTRAPSHGSW